jgi:Family of unknown function (DUF5681)
MGEQPETSGKAGSKAKPEHLWKKGVSGNPAGYRRGSKHRATLFAQALFDGECEVLVRTVIEAAKGGDMAAAKLCLERILPPVRERPCTFKLPKLETCQDATNALALILDGMARGELLPHEGEALSNIVSSFVRTAELVDLASRLATLERAAEAHTSPGARYDT